LPEAWMWVSMEPASRLRDGRSLAQHQRAAAAVMHQAELLLAWHGWAGDSAERLTAGCLQALATIKTPLQAAASHMLVKSRSG
jgi:hypothetical protein